MRTRICLEDVLLNSAWQSVQAQWESVMSRSVLVRFNLQLVITKSIRKTGISRID